MSTRARALDAQVVPSVPASALYDGRVEKQEEGRMRVGCVQRWQVVRGCWESGVGSWPGRIVDSSSTPPTAGCCYSLGLAACNAPTVIRGVGRIKWISRHGAEVKLGKR